MKLLSSTFHMMLYDFSWCACISHQWRMMSSKWLLLSFKTDLSFTALIVYFCIAIWLCLKKFEFYLSWLLLRNNLTCHLKYSNVLKRFRFAQNTVCYIYIFVLSEWLWKVWLCERYFSFLSRYILTWFICNDLKDNMTFKAKQAWLCCLLEENFTDSDLLDDELCNNDPEIVLEIDCWYGYTGELC